MSDIAKWNGEIARLQGQLRRTGYGLVAPDLGADAGFFTRMVSRDYRRQREAARLSPRIDTLASARTGVFARTYRAMESSSAALRVGGEKVARAPEPKPSRRTGLDLEQSARTGWT